MSPRVKRVSGYGNTSVNTLRLTNESYDSILSKPAGKFNADFRFDPQTGKYIDNSKMENPAMIAEPEYIENNGPINVTVIDPLSVKQGVYQIRFWNEGVDNRNEPINDFSKGVNDSTRWYIVTADGSPLYYKDSSGIQVPVYEVWSDFTIGRYNEQLFLDLGISVALASPKPVATPLNENMYYQNVIAGGVANSGVVRNASITFADEHKQWLAAVSDFDGYQPYNWIRSGQQYSTGTISSFLGSTDEIRLSEPYLDEDYFRAEPDPKYNNSTNYPPMSWGVDPSQEFEDVLLGYWSPYGLVSTLPFHPGFSFAYYIADQSVLDSLNTVFRGTKVFNYNEIRRGLFDNLRNKSLMFNDLSALPSVRIVFTADTSKWTRCPVLEMCDDHTQSEGNARRFHIRKHKSVDKLGRTIDDYSGMTADTTNPNNPAYISEEGMGWFPGYAISTATGERLNIMFGEDSRYVQYNGRDMMWNPVATDVEGVSDYVMGGRHFIYVMNATKQKFWDIKNNVNPTSPDLTTFRTPSYDAGRWAVKMLSSLDRLMQYNNAEEVYSLSHGVVNSLRNSTAVIPVRDSIELLFASCAWVNMPLVSDRYIFKYPGNNAELNAGEDYFGNSWYNGIACDVTVDIDVNMPYNLYMSANETRINQVIPGHAIVNSNMPVFQFEITGSDMTLTDRVAARKTDKDYRDSILSLINVVPNPYYSYSDYETASQLETKVRIVNLPTGFNEQGAIGANISIYTVDGTLVRKFPTVPVNQTTYDWDLHNQSGIPIAGGMYFIHVEVPGIGERVIKWFGTMRPVDLNSFQF